MRSNHPFRFHPIAAIALVAALGSAHAADEKFVEKAAQGGMAEVAAGELAKNKASSDAVKQFASQMVSDHTKANDELKMVATKQGVTVPAAPDAAHQKAMGKLESKSGTDFDKAYKSQMVDDHKKTVSLFEDEAKSGKDPELKAFASKTLPTLKHHLEMAKGMK